MADSTVSVSSEERSIQNKGKLPIPKSMRSNYRDSSAEKKKISSKEDFIQKQDLDGFSTL